MNLIKRNDRNSLLQLAIFEQLAGDLLVLNDNVIQLAPCSEFQRRGLAVVLFCQGDKGCYETFDLVAVEIRCGIAVRKIKNREGLAGGSEVLVHGPKVLVSEIYSTSVPGVPHSAS